MDPVNLILDTDLDTDCDDVGALAVAHALRRQGRLRVAAVVCSAPVVSAAACAQFLNEYAGAADIPVGQYRVPPEARSPRFDAYDAHRRRAEELYAAAGGLYNDLLAETRFGGRLPDFPDAVALYRRVLARAPDAGVVVCAVGTLSALDAFLDSGPDAATPLHGRELAARKVRLLVTMAVGTYPCGRDCFNWAMDPTAARAVLHRWPGPVAVSPAGEDVLTGATLAARLAGDNPFRRAYEIHRGGPGRSRSSWDQIALLYAAGTHPAIFTEIPNQGLRFDPETGHHQWTDAPSDPERRHVMPALPPVEMAALIEELMVRGATAPV
ncbi:MAG: nucleoside hydrolase [Lentisphaeria bacterium]|nr:nucleoside hydrolase [Lentisphaeria bacterium]